MGAEGAGLGHAAVAHHRPDPDGRLLLSRELPRLPRRILAPQLLVGHGEKTAAHGTSDLDADVSRSFGVRRYRHHDGLVQQGDHERQPDRRHHRQLRLHDCHVDRRRHHHPRVALLRRPQHRRAVAGGQGVVSSGAGVERLRGAGLHHHAQRHSDLLHHQCRK